MKVTYTAFDGRTWDTEQECLAWERECRRFEAFTKLASSTLGTIGSPDWDRELSQFFDEVLGSSGLDFVAARHRWDERDRFYLLVDLMRQAEEVQ